MDIYKKLIEFENREKLSNFYWGKIWIYPLVKVPVFYSRATNGSSETNKKNSLNIFKTVIKSFINGTHLFSAKNIRIMFVGNTANRRMSEAGEYRNIYFYPFQKKISKDDQLLFEYPAIGKAHYRPASIEQVYYPDWEIQKIFLKARFINNEPDVNYDVIEDFYARLGVNYNKSFIKDRLVKFSLFVSFFLKFLAQTKPKKIILIDSYNYMQMALCAAAKELNIRTIELQHGIINKFHIPYIYSYVESRTLFPDMLYTFGEYFTTLIKNNSKMFDARNVVSFGSINLEVKKYNPVNLPKSLLKIRKDFFFIYVTSQWNVREVIKKCVLSLSKKIGDKYKIIYKTHPGEKNINQFYKDFEEYKNIILIDNKSIDSIELMKIAHVHSTVFSTSFFESTYFGLPNILIQHDKFSINMNEFIDNNGIFMAENVEKYIHFLHLVENNYSFYKNNVLKISNKFYEKSKGNILL